MPTLTITAKGQITLKQELLRHLNVTPGQKVEVDMLPDGRLVVGSSSPREPLKILPNPRLSQVMWS
jgi:bifunctional DNA-binding transcriptional regulator/antitoxin component of YhaV-PrlF toxin-antitoxin module